MTFYKKILTVMFSVLFFVANAQEREVEMADAMRSNGSIYVVVAVLSVVLAGILVYVISTDKKISRIEKDLENK